jgi:hypothetical protein
MLIEGPETNIWVNYIEDGRGILRLGNTRRWSGPVKDVVEQLTIDLVAGRVLGCAHLDRPQAVFVRMTRPDRVYCRACALSELVPHFSQLPRVTACEACGRSSARIKLGGSTLQVGAVTMLGHICKDCLHR